MTAQGLRVPVFSTQGTCVDPCDGSRGNLCHLDHRRCVAQCATTAGGGRRRTSPRVLVPTRARCVGWP
eukprot:4747559-Prymnesium_polylepis.1